YTAESDFELMKQIIETEAPRPSTVCAGYPGELEAIVMRALARDVNERFATAQELHDALESFVARAGLTTAPAVLGRFMRERIRISPAGDLVVAAPAVSNLGDVTDVAGIADVEHHAMPTRHTHSTLSLSSPEPLPAAPPSRRVTSRRTVMLALALAVCVTALGLWQVRSTGESIDSSIDSSIGSIGSIGSIDSSIGSSKPVTLTESPSLPAAVPAALPTRTPTPATPVAAVRTNEPADQMAAPAIEAKQRSRTPGQRTSKSVRSPTKRRVPVPSRRVPTGRNEGANKPTAPADGYLDAPLPPP
ncbi:MAG: hypothetical protein M3619_31365, partial [Myxococcota bacterium]|nr:hypothetical protein [Myxococcota bacterium]